MSFQRADTARVSVALVLPNGGNTIAATTTANGLLEAFTVVAPAITGTLTLSITDIDGTPIYSAAGIAQGNTFTYRDVNNQPLRLPMAGTHTVTVTSTSNQTSAAPVTVNLLITK